VPLRQEGFLRSAAVAGDRDAFPLTIPALARLYELDFDPRVTFLVGENGSGKSTLLEGLAVAAGFNAEGGSRNMQFATRESHSGLHEQLKLVWSRRPRTGFFLRAESFFNVASQVDELGGEILNAYGGTSLHEQSHGESFIALATNRFGPNGLYFLDEPEAALSPRGQLALLRRMHDLVREGGQFVVATHSPILLAYPGATIYRLDEDGVAATPYDATEQVELTRSFLEDPQRFLRHLLADD
jgi:predicted ATPase